MSFFGFGGSSKAQEEQAMMDAIAEMQAQDTLKKYNTLVERCFDHCVENFRTDQIDRREDQCLNHCTAKFIAYSRRLELRVAEEAQKTQQVALGATQQ